MKHKLMMRLFIVCISLLAFSCSTVDATASPGHEKVVLTRTPGEGIQPQAAIDDAGVLHLIYFKGEPKAGDIFYVRRALSEERFSEPIRVNSHPGSAIAAGNIRGAHIAVGRAGRVHVSWMGAKGAEPSGPSGATPMLYARLNDAKTAFEPQRNVMQFAEGLDGGGSIAADRSANVYVAWHARGETKGEAARRVWVARSKDEGKSFEREVPASDGSLGACACCGMRAFAASDRTLYMLYRAATGGVDRDMYLITAKVGGKNFQATRLHQWKLEACPMSTAAISQSGDGMLLAWETQGQIYYSKVDLGMSKVSSPIAAPGEGSRRKHPMVISNDRGETLLVWTEGMVWNKGGAVAWQVFDKSGQPTGEKGRAGGVPTWSLVTAYARPDGGFTIIY